MKFIVGAAKNLQEGAGCCALFATYYIRKAGRVTRKVGVGGRSRAGPCPAPTGWRVFDCVVFPVGCDARQIATGGIYAAPTNQPVIFIKI